MAADWNVSSGSGGAPGQHGKPGNGGRVGRGGDAYTWRVLSVALNTRANIDQLQGKSMLAIDIDAHRIV